MLVAIPSPCIIIAARRETAPQGLGDQTLAHVATGISIAGLILGFVLWLGLREDPGPGSHLAETLPQAVRWER